jgi:hypothetical protein
MGLQNRCELLRNAVAQNLHEMRIEPLRILVEQFLDVFAGSAFRLAA